MTGGEHGQGQGPRVDKEQEFREALEHADDATVRRAFVEAGEAYEYYGGHWSYGLAHEEMERRGLMP